MNLTEIIKKHPLLTCFTAGIIYSVQFWSDYTFIFAFPGLALYFIALFSTPRKAFFRYSYMFFMGFFLPLYYWFSALYPFSGFGFTKAEGISVVIIACVGISLYHSLLCAAVMWLLKFAPQSKRLHPLCFACLWVVAEWVLSVGELSFSWGKTAIGQVSFLPMVETASLFGSYFIAFTVAAVSAYAASALWEKQKVLAFAAAGILLLNLTAGTVIMLCKPKEENKTDIAVIQGCVLSEDKWQSGYYQNIVDTHVAMCEEAAENGAEIIFLAESPFPMYGSERYEKLKPLVNVAKKKAVTIFTGVLVEDAEDNNFNSIVAIYPDGSISERYDKRHPVPFGEMLPYGNILGKLVPALESLNYAQWLTAGEDTSLIQAEGFTFAPLVCFDSIFSSFSREAVKDGGDIIFVATNDSWYKSTRGVYEHLKFSQLRAIENGRYVVRAANTGISTVIDSRGNITCRTQPMEKDILYGQIYSSTVTTLYTVIGDSFLYICIFAVVLFAVYPLYKKILKRKQGNENEN